MIEVRDNCTGCMACKYICPKAAITMDEDVEGFLYPVINMSKCIGCNICENMCPIEKPIDYDSNYEQKYYAARLINRAQRLETQSGGVCDCFSTAVVKEGKGSVYGVGFDDRWNVIHKRATDIDSIKEFRGSKYVQSNIANVYETIISDIQNEDIQQIVVTGTPCQIAGVKAYLRQKRKQLNKVIFVDIICHGCPSPKIWREYLDTERDKEKILNVKFRDKRFGWGSHSETYMYKNKTTHGRIFTRLFYMEVINRKCCSTCKYTSFKRESDITVADFWGYKRAGISYDSFGISECLINTPKGEQFFNECKETLDVVSITKGQADQWNLNKPTIVNETKREEFWKLYNEGGYYAVRDTYCKEEIKNERNLRAFFLLKSLKRIITGR